MAGDGIHHGTTDRSCGSVYTQPEIFRLNFMYRDSALFLGREVLRDRVIADTEIFESVTYRFCATAATGVNYKNINLF